MFEGLERSVTSDVEIRHQWRVIRRHLPFSLPRIVADRLERPALRGRVVIYLRGHPAPVRADRQRTL